MHPSPTARRAVAALVLGATASGSGCAGDPDADARCLSQAYNAAEAGAVARLYARGELGTRQVVQRALGTRGMRFFDEQDRMIPYADLSSDEQNQLVLWFNTGHVGRITEDAREQAVSRTDPDC